MLKDITLGQFFPGDTLAHKLDPRTKLLVTVLYVVALFTAKSYIAYGLLILTLIVAVRISRVGAKALFKGLKPVLFIIAFTALLNLFYTPGTELCHFWIFRITIEGVRAAITMMLRITLLIMGTFLLTYTTSPIRLTDDELATAMECRCYHGDEGRTKLNVLHYQTRDYLVLGYYAVLVAAVIALR